MNWFILEPILEPLLKIKFLIQFKYSILRIKLVLRNNQASCIPKHAIKTVSKTQRYFFVCFYSKSGVLKFFETVDRQYDLNFIGVCANVQLKSNEFLYKGCFYNYYYCYYVLHLKLLNFFSCTVFHFNVFQTILHISYHFSSVAFAF